MKRIALLSGALAALLVAAPANASRVQRSIFEDDQTLVLSSPTPSAAEVAAANKRALEQVAIAQQAMVGQFWTDPALRAFLQGLPTS